MTTAPDDRSPDSKDSSHSVRLRHRSLQIQSVRGRGRSNARIRGRRRRQGVNPEPIRPKSRASGCNKHKKAVMPRSLNSGTRERERFEKVDLDAEIQALVTDAVAASAATGVANQRGLHKLPSAESAARQAMIKYHSGIRGRDARNPLEG